MGKWKEVKLGNIAFTKSGGTPKRGFKAYWENGTIPWLKSGELNDNKNITQNTEFITDEALQNSSAKLFPKGSLLLAMYGATAGKLGILGKDAATNQAVCSIQNKKGLFVEEFIFNFLLLIREDIIRDSFGGAQPNISKSYIDNIKIPLPPLPEQQRIVAKLDGLFAKIDQAIGLLEENMTHTQALMGSVLDEEFGKLEKFNKPIMTFCKNPKKDMVGGPFGSNLKASEYVEKGYPIIRLQNVDRFNFKEKNIMFVTEEKAEFLSRHSYDSGDIVMTKLGDPLGKCCIVKDVLGVNKGVISSDIIRIRIDESKHYKPYVVAGINSEYFIKQLKSKTQGSTRPRVTLKEVRAMQLPMLKREDQVLAAERIDGILDLQSKVIETQTQKLNHLKALKSSLLDQAFKGEL